MSQRLILSFLAVTTFILPAADAAPVQDLLGGDEQARAAAIDSVRQMDDGNKEKIVATLVKAVKQTEDIDRREHAIVALGALKGAAAPAVPALQAALSDDLPYIRTHAAEALRAIGRPAVPAFTNALKNPNSDVRSISASALGDAGSDAADAAPELSKLLHDSERPVRERAAHALTQIGEASVVPLLDEIRSSPSSRLLAVKTLADVKSTNPDVVNQFIELLKSNDSQVRLVSMRALSHRAPASVEPLIGALQDSDANAREMAAEALADMGKPGKAAVPALTPLLKDSEASVRAAAARALGKMGSASKPSVASLREATQDSDSTVSARALEALTSLGASLHESKKEQEAAVETPAEPKPVVQKIVPAKPNIKKLAPKKAAAARGVSSAQLGRWVNQLSSTATSSGIAAYQGLVAAGPRAVPLLTSVLEKPAPSTDPILAMDVLADIGPKAASAWPAVFSYIHSSTPTIRATVPVVLARVDAASLPGAMLGLLKETDMAARTTALAAFTIWGSSTPEVVSAVAAQLNENDKDLRTAAVSVLTSLATPEAKTALDAYEKQQSQKEIAGHLKALRSNRTSVDQASVDALVKKGREAVPALTSALKDPTPTVREGAARALKALGPAAAPATKALIDALDDSVAGVRQTSADALARIGTPEAQKSLRFFSVKEKVRSTYESVTKKAGH